MDQEILHRPDAPYVESPSTYWCGAVVTHLTLWR